MSFFTYKDPPMMGRFKPLKSDYGHFRAANIGNLPRIPQVRSFVDENYMRNVLKQREKEFEERTQMYALFDPFTNIAGRDRIRKNMWFDGLPIIDQVATTALGYKEIFWDQTFSHIFDGDFGQGILNSFRVVGDSFDILSLLVKAPIYAYNTPGVAIGEAYKRAYGFGDDGRHIMWFAELNKDINWLPENFATNLIGEILIDPLNWASIGLAAATNIKRQVSQEVFTSMAKGVVTTYKRGLSPQIVQAITKAKHLKNQPAVAQRLTRLIRMRDKNAFIRTMTDINKGVPTVVFTPSEILNLWNSATLSIKRNWAMSTLQTINKAQNTLARTLRNVTPFGVTVGAAKRSIKYATSKSRRNLMDRVQKLYRSLDTEDIAGLSHYAPEDIQGLYEHITDLLINAVDMGMDEATFDKLMRQKTKVYNAIKVQALNEAQEVMTTNLNYIANDIRASQKFLKELQEKQKKLSRIKRRTTQQQDELLKTTNQIEIIKAKIESLEQHARTLSDLATASTRIPQAIAKLRLFKSNQGAAFYKKAKTTIEDLSAARKSLREIGEKIATTKGDEAKRALRIQYEDLKKEIAIVESMQVVMDAAGASAEHSDYVGGLLMSSENRQVREFLLSYASEMQKDAVAQGKKEAQKLLGDNLEERFQVALEKSKKETSGQFALLDWLEEESPEDFEIMNRYVENVRASMMWDRLGNMDKEYTEILDTEAREIYARVLGLQKEIESAKDHAYGNLLDELLKIDTGKEGATIKDIMHAVTEKLYGMPQQNARLFKALKYVTDFFNDLMPVHTKIRDPKTIAEKAVVIETMITNTSSRRIKIDNALKNSKAGMDQIDFVRELKAQYNRWVGNNKEYIPGQTDFLESYVSRTKPHRVNIAIVPYLPENATVQNHIDFLELTASGNYFAEQITKIRHSRNVIKQYLNVPQEELAKGNYNAPMRALTERVNHNLKKMDDMLTSLNYNRSTTLNNYETALIQRNTSAEDVMRDIMQLIRRNPNERIIDNTQRKQLAVYINAYRDIQLGKAHGKIRNEDDLQDELYKAIFESKRPINLEKLKHVEGREAIIRKAKKHQQDLKIVNYYENMPSKELPDEARRVYDVLINQGPQFDRQTKELVYNTLGKKLENSYGSFLDTTDALLSNYMTQHKLTISHMVQKNIEFARKKKTTTGTQEVDEVVAGLKKQLIQQLPDELVDKLPNDPQFYSRFLMRIYKDVSDKMENVLFDMNNVDNILRYSKESFQRNLDGYFDRLLSRAKTKADSDNIELLKNKLRKIEKDYKDLPSDYERKMDHISQKEYNEAIKRIKREQKDVINKLLALEKKSGLEEKHQLFNRLQKTINFLKEHEQNIGEKIFKTRTSLDSVISAIMTGKEYTKREYTPLVRGLLYQFELGQIHDYLKEIGVNAVLDAPAFGELTRGTAIVSELLGDLATLNYARPKTQSFIDLSSKKHRNFIRKLFNYKKQKRGWTEKQFKGYMKRMAKTENRATLEADILEYSNARFKEALEPIRRQSEWIGENMSTERMIKRVEHSLKNNTIFSKLWGSSVLDGTNKTPFLLDLGLRTLEETNTEMSMAARSIRTGMPSETFDNINLKDAHFAIIDAETMPTPDGKEAPVQFAMVIVDPKGKIVGEHNIYLQLPEGVKYDAQVGEFIHLPKNVYESPELSKLSHDEFIEQFNKITGNYKDNLVLMGHNVDFDIEAMFGDYGNVADLPYLDSLPFLRLSINEHLEEYARLYGPHAHKTAKFHALDSLEAIKAHRQEYLAAKLGDEKTLAKLKKDKAGLSPLQDMKDHNALMDVLTAHHLLFDGMHPATKFQKFFADRNVETLGGLNDLSTLVLDEDTLKHFRQLDIQLGTQKDTIADIRTSVLGDLFQPDREGAEHGIQFFADGLGQYQEELITFRDVLKTFSDKPTNTNRYELQKALDRLKDAEYSVKHQYDKLKETGLYVPEGLEHTIAELDLTPVGTQTKSAIAMDKVDNYYNKIIKRLDKTLKNLEDNPDEILSENKLQDLTDYLEALTGKPVRDVTGIIQHPKYPRMDHLDAPVGRSFPYNERWPTVTKVHENVWLTIESPVKKQSAVGLRAPTSSWDMKFNKEKLIEAYEAQLKQIQLDKQAYISQNIGKKVQQKGYQYRAFNMDEVLDESFAITDPIETRLRMLDEVEESLMTSFYGNSTGYLMDSKMRAHFVLLDSWRDNALHDFADFFNHDFGILGESQGAELLASKVRALVRERITDFDMPKEARKKLLEAPYEVQMAEYKKQFPNDTIPQFLNEIEAIDEYAQNQAEIWTIVNDIFESADTPAARQEARVAGAKLYDYMYRVSQEVENMLEGKRMRQVTEKELQSIFTEKLMGLKDISRIKDQALKNVHIDQYFKKVNSDPVKLFNDYVTKRFKAIQESGNLQQRVLLNPDGIQSNKFYYYIKDNVLDAMEYLEQTRKRKTNASMKSLMKQLADEGDHMPVSEEIYYDEAFRIMKEKLEEGLHQMREPLMEIKNSKYKGGLLHKGRVRQALQDNLETFKKSQVHSEDYTLPLQEMLSEYELIHQASDMAFVQSAASKKASKMKRSLYWLTDDLMEVQEPTRGMSKYAANFTETKHVELLQELADAVTGVEGTDVLQLTSFARSHVGRRVKTIEYAEMFDSFIEHGEDLPYVQRIKRTLEQHFKKVDEDSLVFNFKDDLSQDLYKMRLKATLMEFMETTHIDNYADVMAALKEKGMTQSQIFRSATKTAVPVADYMGDSYMQTRQLFDTPEEFLKYLRSQKDLRMTVLVKDAKSKSGLRVEEMRLNSVADVQELDRMMAQRAGELGGYHSIGLTDINMFNKFKKWTKQNFKFEKGSPEDIFRKTILMPTKSMMLAQPMFFINNVFEATIKNFVVQEGGIFSPKSIGFSIAKAARWRKIYLDTLKDMSEVVSYRAFQKDYSGALVDTYIRHLKKNNLYTEEMAAKMEVVRFVHDTMGENAMMAEVHNFIQNIRSGIVGIDVDDPIWERTFNKIFYGGKFSPFRVNLQVNSEVEIVSRLALHINNIEKGITPHESLSRVLRTHFDYSNKTKAELYGEMVIPFLTFPLRSIDFWHEHLFARGDTARLMTDIIFASWSWEELTENDYAAYQATRGHLAMGEYSWQIGLPYVDAMNVLTATQQPPIPDIAYRKIQPHFKNIVLDTERPMEERVTRVPGVSQVAQLQKSFVGETTGPSAVLPGIAQPYFRGSSDQLHRQFSSRHPLTGRSYQTIMQPMAFKTSNPMGYTHFRFAQAPRRYRW